MTVVASVHIAPARRAPMVEVDSVEAEAGAGLVGDRYHGTRHRHVTVQSRTQLDEAARDLGAPIPSRLTRRNVTLDAGVIPTEPGARILLGDVELEVVRKAAPCRLMDRVIGDGARRALHGRGGAVCRVITSGTIAVGDVAKI
jgi:MOSC domain-containing protein YiiM